jgi:hypothetical protein
MLHSLLVLRPAFNAFVYVELLKDPDLLPPSKAELADWLRSELWWSRLTQLHDVLSPFNDVVMAIQGNDSTLACVTRYWLYLNRSVGEQLEALQDPEYKQHVLKAFNKRAVEMDSPLCRLALFLDPRFRAIGGTSASFDELQQQVRRCGTGSSTHHA